MSDLIKKKAEASPNEWADVTKDLVGKALQHGSQMMGKSDDDRAREWLNDIAWFVEIAADEVQLSGEVGPRLIGLLKNRHKAVNKVLEGTKYASKSRDKEERLAAVVASVEVDCERGSDDARKKAKRLNVEAADIRERE